MYIALSLNQFLKVFGKSDCVCLFHVVASLYTVVTKHSYSYHFYEEVNWWQTSGWSMAAAVSSSTMLVATMMPGTSSSESFAVMLTITIAALSASEAIC